MKQIPPEHRGVGLFGHLGRPQTFGTVERSRVYCVQRPCERRVQHVAHIAKSSGEAGGTRTRDGAPRPVFAFLRIPLSSMDLRGIEASAFARRFSPNRVNNMQFCYGFATLTSAWPAEQPPFQFLRCFSRFHDLTETSGP